MRLTLTTFLTLDGVMQGPGAPDEDRGGGFELGGWLSPYFDEAVGAQMTGVFERAEAFLLGRHTYDIFAAWWPRHGDPTDPIADALNRLPKHVATSRTDELAWSGSQRLDGDLVTAVTELKSRPGRELQVHGSGRLAVSLMREGLIDTYHLLVFPVVLGRGRRLFADGVPPAALRLVDSRTSGSGVAMLTYHSAGTPTFGSVAD
ncbi:Dihydrofolate reductase [Micromonospora phaseoli]|uniref:Dihydrofolate reductase n=1 Tax=Micromonospora phaseoli TaxID=1144548 RepID=A0A1H6YCL1_9ACTN|nr:dihydrofolate reductase family protein [Micromonospora phaseoli]PZW00133.1 dihydrofolate reductase [Micromonospora phaseoli]GIJ78840.1 deaminase reductase [Micromonospora phaseoli]SEJ38991.1 Dihydrofolate reductase [Micromonospora phaseoli]